MHEATSQVPHSFIHSRSIAFFLQKLWYLVLSKRVELLQHMGNRSIHLVTILSRLDTSRSSRINSRKDKHVWNSAPLWFNIAVLIFLKAKKDVLHASSLIDLGSDSVAGKALSQVFINSVDPRLLVLLYRLFSGIPGRKTSGLKCSYNRSNLRQMLSSSTSHCFYS